MASPNKMNPIAKEAWLKELRSGNYKQGSGYLHFGDEYCCLGVLCEVAIKHGIELTVTTEEAAKYVEDTDTEELALRYRYDESGAHLPLKVSQWAGFGMTSNPELGFVDDGEDDFIEVCATDANDDHEFSFARIADIIEANL